MNSAPQTLQRTLAYRDLLAYGLAYIAPVAPLSTFGFVWNAAGGPIALAYLFGAVCMYFTARSYAEMTAELPNAGSVYGFARQVLGEWPGFIAGWLILLDYLLIPALIFLLMSAAMDALVPQIGRTVWILAITGVAVGINWLGIRVSSRVNHFSVVVQFAILAVLLVLGLRVLYGADGGGLSLDPLYSPASFAFDKLLAATAICVFSFLGFDAVSTLAEEVKTLDRKLVGRAIVHVLLISGTLFFLTAWLLGDLMRGVSFADPATASLELVAQRIGPDFALVLALVMVFVVGFTNVLPMQVGVSRVLYAMGRDKQLPAILARLHGKRATPHVALLFSSAVSLGIALALEARMDLLATVVNFGALSAFLILHLAVLRHLAWRRRSRRVFAHWLVPILGSAVVLAVFAAMDPLALQIGGGWLFAGVAYRAVARTRRHGSAE